MTKTSLKLISLMVLTPTVLAGSLEPPSAPTGASSAMYSIQSLCDRLQTGAAGSQNLFTEPTSGPVATGCTLNDVMSKAPVLDNTTGATPADVATGKKFWGLKSGSWGLQTGTASGGGSAAVPRTGQTATYATGDDGTLQKGVALPSPRFTDNSNGTVTDNLTGLIWLKNANCINTNNSSFDNDSTAGDGMVTWQHALDFVAGLNAGTYSCGDTSNSGSHQTDWRLPNVKELQSLIHYGYFNPSLSNAAGTAKWTAGDAFLNVQSNYYWSASSNANITTQAWVVSLLVGNVSAHVKTTTNYVWPVRGG